VMKLDWTAQAREAFGAKVAWVVPVVAVEKVAWAVPVVVAVEAVVSFLAVRRSSHDLLFVVHPCVNPLIHVLEGISSCKEQNDNK